MISRLELTNFQNHKHTTLNFVDGVNVIAGTSDSGKSAIIRALNLVLFNKPLGSIGYRNKDCGKNDVMSVSISFDGNKLERNRSEKVNEYVLNGTSFVALKSDVPSEISDLLSVSDINMLGQFDPFYLLSSSSGEVAKTLNNVCNLSIIDNSIKKINSIITTGKQDLARQEMEEDSTHRKMKEFSWLEEAEHSYASLAEKCEKLESKKNKAEGLSKRILYLQQSMEEIHKLKHTDGLYKRCNDLSVSAQGIDNKRALKSNLERLCASIETTEQQLTKMYLDVSMAELESLQKTYNDVSEKVGEKEQLRTIMNGIFSTSKQVSAAKEIEEDKKAKLKKVIGSIDICPFCERSM